MEMTRVTASVNDLEIETTETEIGEIKLTPADEKRVARSAKEFAAACPAELRISMRKCEPSKKAVARLDHQSQRKTNSPLFISTEKENL